MKEAQLGLRYHSHLMERGSRTFRVPGRLYLDRLSFVLHILKDTWCMGDVPAAHRLGVARHSANILLKAAPSILVI